MSRKQDGEPVAFFVLISIKKEEKEKDHCPEESRVITREFFLVERCKENTSGKPGVVNTTTTGDSQSSQEQWTKKKQKGIEVERRDESFL